MTALLVAYDLRNEVRRPAIVAEVKRNDWARLSESAYVIDTDETPRQVLNRFAKHLDADDQLYVIRQSRPWTGRGPQDVNQFLTKLLGPAE